MTRRTARPGNIGGRAAHLQTARDAATASERAGAFDAHTHAFWASRKVVGKENEAPVPAQCHAFWAAAMAKPRVGACGRQTQDFAVAALAKARIGA